MSAIDLDKVSKFYGSVRAVDDISLSLKAGELTAVLGPSGSGKSTILSMIAGIDTPTLGTISIGGVDMTHAAPGERNVGLVFQSYALFPNLSVFENVAFPLRVRRLPSAEVTRRVEEVLALVHLSEFKSRKPSQLSGGQQQRVAIARAIVFKPSVLLLDEPLAALDRKLREDVRLELRRLQRSLGITTVLVTHDQDEAMTMADQIVVIADGKVQQVDAPLKIYQQPVNRFVAGFLGIANVFTGVFAANGKEHKITLPNGEQIACTQRPRSAGNGGEVCGILRPEQIVVREPTGKARMKARIEDVLFFGESVRYILVSEGGHPMVAQASNPKTTFQPGVTVSLEWSPDDIWILPSSQTNH
jgi:putative spermidine/putrescine transport system ATP-binding protein/spermidine/putrescine transport system ATP-binding protein